MQAHRPGEILVVDGSSEFLTFAASTLNRRGHTVRVCAYASEARHHVERHFFDAILCSLRLPDGTGPDFCAWIKGHEDLQGVPVALVGDVQSVQAMGPAHGRLLGEANTGAPLLSGPLAPDEFILLPVRAEEFSIRVGALLKLRRYREEIGNVITTLLAVAEGTEEQDSRSRGHCRRLSIMSVLLGAALCLDEYHLLTLERAGYLHDIGKVSIPGAILEKSQPLNAREMDLIKNHCALGEKLCQPIVGLQLVLPIVRHHHERGDGSGYPDGLKSDRIPRLAQLFSIVDVYDSLRTWRPYRVPLSQDLAVEVMRDEVRRGFWNREIFETFARDIVPVLDTHFRDAKVMWPSG